MVSFLGNEASPWRLMQGSAGLVQLVSADQDVPSAVLDAVAAGCPIISTKNSIAMEEFLGDSERGVLVRVKDAAALADAMLQVVWDDEARHEMVRRGIEHLESISAETVVPRLERLIEDSVRGDKGSSQA